MSVGYQRMTRTEPNLTRQQRRILDLARRLLAAKADLDLDAVDGEFYWRFCRRELLVPLTGLLQAQAPHLLPRGHGVARFDDDDRRLLDAVPDFVFGSVSDDGVFVADEPGLDEDSAYYRVLHERSALYRQAEEWAKQLPEFVWHHLMTGKWLPLSPPMGLGPDFDSSTLRLAVFSARIAGEDVAAALAFWDETRAYPYPYPVYELDPFQVLEDEAVEIPGGGPRGLPIAEPMASERDPVGWRFELVEAPPVLAPWQVPREPEHRPYVSVTATLPLPAPAAIGAAYDAVVRGQRRWHLRLGDAGTEQDVTVAIRTWAIGLLMHEGLTFQDARTALAKLLGPNLPGQEADRQARNKLVERVPQAAACVRSKRKPKV